MEVRSGHAESATVTTLGRGVGDAPQGRRLPDDPGPRAGYVPGYRGRGRARRVPLEERECRSRPRTLRGPTHSTGGGHRPRLAAYQPCRRAAKPSGVLPTRRGPQGVAFPAADEVARGGSGVSRLERFCLDERRRRGPWRGRRALLGDGPLRLRGDRERNLRGPRRELAPPMHTENLSVKFGISRSLGERDWTGVVQRRWFGRRPW